MSRRGQMLLFIQKMLRWIYLFLGSTDGVAHTHKAATWNQLSQSMELSRLLNFKCTIDSAVSANVSFQRPKATAFGLFFLITIDVLLNDISVGFITGISRWCGHAGSEKIPGLKGQTIPLAGWNYSKKVSSLMRCVPSPKLIFWWFSPLYGLILNVMTRKQTAGIIHEMPCDGPASFSSLWKTVEMSDDSLKRCENGATDSEFNQVESPSFKRWKMTFNRRKLLAPSGRMWTNFFPKGM